MATTVTLSIPVARSIAKAASFLCGLAEKQPALVDGLEADVEVNEAVAEALDAINTVTFSGRADAPHVAIQMTAFDAIRGHGRAVAAAVLDGDLLTDAPEKLASVTAAREDARSLRAAIGHAEAASTGAGTPDIVSAALQNLELDLNGRDDGALDVVREYTGKPDLDFSDALALVAEEQG